MEKKKAAAVMQDFDAASDCSHFSIITPPSPPPVSSCGKCCSQDEAQEKDSDVAPVTNGHKRIKDERCLPTKSKKREAEAPKSCIHSLNEQVLSSKLAEMKMALMLQNEAAVKPVKANNSTVKDILSAGFLDPQIDLQKEMVASLQNQYQHLWEGVISLLRQAMFQDDHPISGEPQKNPPLDPADRLWCLDLVRNAFITSIVDNAKHDAASMLATPALATDAMTGLPPNDKKKKKKKANQDWGNDLFRDPFVQAHPESYGMPPLPPPPPLPMEQYPGPPPEPYAGAQPMPYPPPPNPDAYGMHHMEQYPGPPEDPYTRARPISPPPPPPPPQAYDMPPPVEQYPGPSDPFAGMDMQPRPYRRRSKAMDSSVSLDLDEEPKCRVNKTEVRWWLRTALNFSEVLCMFVIIIAVFRTPGLLGELLDIMHPRNKDRCLGFNIRR